MRENKKTGLINEDIHCERNKQKKKKELFPPLLLGSALILWWCIQHSDVIPKSHLVLPDPIKSEYDGGNTDVWLYGPEHTHQVNVPEKAIFLCAPDWGLCGLFFERGRENLQFHSCPWNSTHFSFWFRKNERKMNQAVLWCSKWSAMHNIDLSGCFFLFFFVWELNVCFTLYLCLECFRFASKKTNMLKLNGKRQRDNTGSESVSEAVWPWDEPLALCVAGPRENEEESRNNRRSSKAWNVRKSEGRGFRCELICVYVPEWTEGVGDVGVLRGLTGIPQ